MRMKWICPLALSFFIIGAARAEQPAAQARPNVVLCMTDDQGWGDVSYNGLTKIKTPVLDAMAANGICFDRFYAAAPVCSPTRASVLSVDVSDNGWPTIPVRPRARAY